MYESFFGLHRPPFDLTADPRLLVLTDTHGEALRTLDYGISSRKGMILLTGVPGSGKTTVVRSVLEGQSTRVKSVYFTNPAVTREDFLLLLAERLGLSEQASRSKGRFVSEFEDLIRSRGNHGMTTVIAMDEAQGASVELLEEMRLLANVERTDAKLLTVVLAGQLELAARLDNPRLSQLKQRIELRCELRPLTQDETVRYVVHRIERSGGEAAALFTREAVVAIHELSQGIPRMISVLANNALLSAFAAEQRKVTVATVHGAARSLHIGPSFEAIAAAVRDVDVVGVDSPASQAELSTTASDHESEPPAALALIDAPSPFASEAIEIAAAVAPCDPPQLRGPSPFGPEADGDRAWVAS